MTDKALQTINVMPSMFTQGSQVVSKSPFHTITRQVFQLSTRSEDKEVYPTGKRVVINDEWVDVLAPSKNGLMKFCLSGGIQTVSSKPERLGGRLWRHEVILKYTLPDGTSVTLPGTYEFDARKGGERWQEKYNQEMDKQARGLIKERTNKKYIKAEEIEACLLNLTDETREKLHSKAVFRADRFVDQAAQYGTRRAETGAILAALRDFFLIRTYTAHELETSCFEIYRAEFDTEGLQAQVGEKNANALMTVLAGQKMGLPDNVVAMITDKVFSDEIAPAMQTVSADEIGDNVVEQLEEEPTQEELESAAYKTPLAKSTETYARDLMKAYHGWARWSRADADEKSQRLVGKDWRDLSDGEGLVMVEIYEILNKRKDEGLAQADRNKMAAYFAEAARRVISERRLWRSEDANMTQAELPGMPAQEEESDEKDNNSDQEG
jgi:hypothetical protein